MREFFIVRLCNKAIEGLVRHRNIFDDETIVGQWDWEKFSIMSLQKGSAGPLEDFQWRVYKEVVDFTMKEKVCIVFSKIAFRRPARMLNYSIIFR